MQRIEYRTIDKSQWGEGPWQNEPDKIQWQDEETGYPCLIHRAHKELGHLCGYVGVPHGHPAYNKDYAAVPDIDVHGGLTFAGPCQSGPDESHGICHKPEPGEPDDIYWLGFDCAHLWDYAPAMVAGVRARGISYGENDVYRDIAYVTSECQKLAKQLKAMEK